MEKQFYFNAQPIVALNNYREYDVQFYELLLQEVTTNCFPGQKFFDLIANETGNARFMLFFEQQIRLILQSKKINTVSINLDTVQLDYAATYIFLEKLSDLSAAIILEITEREYSAKTTTITDFILFAKSQGYRIVLDDIDVHSHLEAAEVDALGIIGVKISHEVIHKLPMPSFRRRITRFNAKMAAIHVDVIMEGVAEEAQVVRLFDLGIKYQQGYHFANQDMML